MHVQGRGLKVDLLKSNYLARNVVSFFTIIF
jgi:hypothetical protein